MHWSLEACADIGKWLLTVRDSYLESFRSWVGPQEDWRMWRIVVCRRRGPREDDVGQDVRRIRLDCSLMSPCPAAAMHQAQAQEPSAVRARTGFSVRC